MTVCVFCAKIDTVDAADRRCELVVRVEPLNPVTPGHMLFIPGWHAEHPDPDAVREAMGYAAIWAAAQGEDFNLIVSCGPDATQTVPHVHVHYVPRRAGDGLALPWTGQKRR